MTIEYRKLISPAILDDVNIKMVTCKHYTNAIVSDILEVPSINDVQSNDLLYFLIKLPSPELA